MRWGGVAILLGAVVGVAGAVALREGDSPPRDEPRAAVAKRGAAEASSSTPATSAAPESNGSESDAPSAGPSTQSTTATAPSAAPAASAATSSSAPTPARVLTAPVASSFPYATPLPPVTSAKELERAEIRCYEVDPEECGRAADAYDIGQLVPRDAARAEHLRKVELTRLVRRCEERSPHACLVLAGRYASGQGVDENDRHARALVAHARELCQRGAKAECAGGEPK